MMEIIIWVCLFAFFVGIEIATMQFVSIWFALSSIVALICSLFELNISIQILAFFGTSVLLLILTRPIYKKVHNAPRVLTNADLEIGKTGLVIEDIINESAAGRVKVEGIDWAARSVTGEKIEKGTNVIVSKMEGTKLFVTVK